MERERELEIEKESIKLTKNAKGGYQWEIKLKEEHLTEKTIVRLYEIDLDMRKKWQIQERTK